jgi:hypothetical protein
MRIATIQLAITCYFHEVLQPDNLVFRMLPYLFTQRDVHSPTVKESLKPRLELGAQTHDALRPACPTSSAYESWILLMEFYRNFTCKSVWRCNWRFKGLSDFVCLENVIYITKQEKVSIYYLKPFLGEFVRAKRKPNFGNVIGQRKHSPRKSWISLLFYLSLRANKFAQWKTSL